MRPDSRVWRVGEEIRSYELGPQVAPWSDESGKDRQQLLEMSLHMADISTFRPDERSHQTMQFSPNPFQAAKLGF